MTQQLTPPSSTLHITPPLRPSTLPWLATASAGPEQKIPWRARWRIAAERGWRWEFWPSWLYYLPIVCWILWLGLKHRSPMAFTASNPGLEASGMVGERKHLALAPLLTNAPDLVATFVLVPAGALDTRLEIAQAFVAAHSLPVVLKPNIGQRGRGVFVARQWHEVHDYLARFTGDVIAQRYVPGQEFGVYVARKPGERRAHILSITHKTFPHVLGDGQHTLRELILNDSRAKLISGLLLSRWAEELDHVPACHERIQLVEIGAHCRGSVFLDANHLATPALVDTLTRFLDALPGYAFGRVDLRVPSVEDFQNGQDLQVLEVNGVSAESAHIYHPGTPLWVGYRAMFRQWSLAFEIGAAHAKSGAPTTSALGLWRSFREDQRRSEVWF
jgi:hypothetical protein